jgi:hypothetical protein
VRLSGCAKDRTTPTDWTPLARRGARANGAALVPDAGARLHTTAKAKSGPAASASIFFRSAIPTLEAGGMRIGRNQPVGNEKDDQTAGGGRRGKADLVAVVREVRLCTVHRFQPLRGNLCQTSTFCQVFVNKAFFFSRSSTGLVHPSNKHCRL